MMNLSATKNGSEVKDFTYNDYLYEVGSGSLTPALDSKLEGVAPGAIIKFNDYLASSKSIIVYGSDRNGYIISRIYNGI